VRVVQRGDPLQPIAHRGRILEAKLPVHAIADGDGNTALVFDCLEAALIGEIVADEHGFLPVKGGSRMNASMAEALVKPRGLSSSIILPPWM